MCLVNEQRRAAQQISGADHICRGAGENHLQAGPGKGNLVHHGRAPKTLCLLLQWSHLTQSVSIRHQNPVRRCVGQVRKTEYDRRAVGPAVLPTWSLLGVL